MIRIRAFRLTALDDFNHLFLGDCQPGDAVRRQDVETDLVEIALNLLPHGGAVQQTPGADFAAEKDIFLHGHLFRQVEFLVDQHDAKLFGAAIRRQPGLLSVQANLAGCRVVEA